MSNRSTEPKSIRSFWREYRFLLFGILIFLLAFYGGRVFHANVSMDSEYMINHPGSYYNWMSLGRFGQCLTKWLLHMGWYNPYFQNLVFLASLWLFAVVMCWLIDGFGVIRRKGLLFLFAALSLTHPVLAEQSYFIMQRAEIGAGYLYTALALAGSFSWLREKKWYWCGLAALFSVLAFATYQSFVPMYMAGALGCYLLYCHGISDGKACLRAALWLAAEFAASLFLYLVLQRMLCGPSGYLDSMVAWGTLPFRTCVKQILVHLWRLVSGQDVYYSVFQGVLMALVVLTALFLLFDKRGTPGKRALTALAALALSFSPLFMTVILGGEPMRRAELMLPVSLGFMLLVSVSGLASFPGGKRRPGRLAAMAALLAACALLWEQAQMSQRLFYTDDMRQKSDERLAGQISREIDALGLEEPVVVFVGSRPADLNESCLVGGSIGLSFFDIFYANEPYYYHSTVRILDFMRTQGFVYTMPTEEQVFTARQGCQDMPSWPQDGSVQQVGDVIVVKLCEDFEYGK